MARPVVFFDRDGIVNQPPPEAQRYITDPADFHLMPGFVSLLRLVTARGWPAVVVTNQKCVALGRLSEAGLAMIHQRMHDLLAAEELALLDVRYCPHEERDACHCRKPLPGMLLDAAAAHDLALNRSWMVGDQPRDCQAGRTAGCRTLLVHPGVVSPHADFHCSDLTAACELLATRLPPQ